MGRMGNMLSFSLLTLSFALSLWALPPDDEELKEFPPAKEMPGDPPASGTRYWQTPWQPLAAAGCYVSVRITGEPGKRKYELWQNSWGDTDAERCIIVSRGPALDKLGPAETAIEGKIITDVFDPKDGTKRAPIPGYTRPFLTMDKEFGYVFLSCVCAEYLPGSVPLLPALLTSKTGDAGSFEYRGQLSGEPTTEAAKRKIWSDGGSIVRLSDGRWRVYVNGFGPVLSILESDKLSGPWTFARDAAGAIREILPDFPKAPNRGGCFPTILRVSDSNWHLWITDTWVPQAIWHFWSADGISWKPYGQQPEITRVAVEGHGIKCIRTYLDPDSGEIIGLLSVWGRHPDGQPGWLLHRSRMPAGPPMK